MYVMFFLHVRPAGCKDLSEKANRNNLNQDLTVFIDDLHEHQSDLWIKRPWTQPDFGIDGTFNASFDFPLAESFAAHVVSDYDYRDGIDARRAIELISFVVCFAVKTLRHLTIQVDDGAYAVIQIKLKMMLIYPLRA